MKKCYGPATYGLVLAMMMLIAASSAIAQTSTPWSLNESPLPPSTGFVNDYVGIFDPATKQQLESKLKDFKEKTSPPVEIAVAVVRTTGDRPISDYALAVYRGWKIGVKDGDNPGALLLVAIDDRKYFTEVGRDLEDELPDGLVGSIQRQYLVPEFKKGNYGKGISDTIDAYIATIQNKGNGNSAPQKPAAGQRDSVGSTGGSIFCCALIILVIVIIIFTRSKGGPTKGDRNRWGGGGFGGSGGGGSSALPWIIGGILSSGGSDSSSSSDWGGSSGGGGWGGFGGGGDAGGGGAGGDW